MNVNLQKLAGDILEASGVDPELLKEVQDGQGNQDTLEQYSTDLTRQAEEGKLDPVVGREEEISRIMQILSRRTKNNPCLIGEPGSRKDCDCGRFGAADCSGNSSG